MMLLQPWAMLANGPPWTSAGALVVWTRLGSSASLSSATIAPTTPSWSAVGLAVMGTCHLHPAEPDAQVVRIDASRARPSPRRP